MPLTVREYGILILAWYIIVPAVQSVKSSKSSAQLCTCGVLGGLMIHVVGTIFTEPGTAVRGAGGLKKIQFY